MIIHFIYRGGALVDKVTVLKYFEKEKAGETPLKVKFADLYEAIKQSE